MHFKERVPMRKKYQNYGDIGIYFITINTKKKGNLLGSIENGSMELNECGFIVKKTWEEIEKFNSNIRLDEYIIMPDHFHGIIEIVDKAGKDLPTIIGIFKSYSSRKINKACRGGSLTLPSGIDKFQWQRSYYDEQIKTKVKYDKIRKYIKDNPYDKDGRVPP